MHTFVLHAWSEAEVQLFSNVAGTIAALIVRLAAEEDANAAREAALRALGLALETRDRETANAEASGAPPGLGALPSCRAAWLGR